MLRNAFRERFEALAPDPLSALINAAPAVAVFLTLICAGLMTATYNHPADERNLFVFDFGRVVFAGGMTAAALWLLRHYWTQIRNGYVRESLYEQLRSNGYTLADATALVGIGQALTAAGISWRRTFAMLRDLPADADVIAETLRRLPIPARRARQDLWPHIVLGALVMALALVVLELSFLAFARAEYLASFAEHSWISQAAFRCALLSLGGTALGLDRWAQRRQLNYLRRGLENCRDAGLDAGNSALFLLHMQLNRNDRKALSFLRAEAVPTTK